MSFWDKKEAKTLFQKLPFCNVLTKKMRIKHLKSIYLLHQLPFYDELSFVKISEAFKWYARSYKIEIIDSKDPLAHSEASQSSIKDLFKDLLDEIKAFKYQINSESFIKKTQRKWRHRICSYLFQFYY